MGSIVEKIVPKAEAYPRSTTRHKGSNQKNRVEPDMGEWMGPITICVHLNRLSLLQEYFSRMNQQLGNVDSSTKYWIQTTYLPSAIYNLDTFAMYTAGNPPVKAAFIPFWQMALTSYVEAVLISDKDQKADEKLVIRALRGGASCDQLQSQ